MTLPKLHANPEPPMSLSNQRLSALMDGDTQAGPEALAAWSKDAQARADWHLYHLVGDALRSQDLVSTAQQAEHDRLFLEGMRQRLAQEAPWRDAELPLALGASHVAARTPLGRWGWGALAASVAALGVVLALNQGVMPSVGERVIAKHSAPAAVGLADPTEVVLRDPRLDEFMRVHRLARGGMPAGLPAGSLRQADLQWLGGHSQ